MGSFAPGGWGPASRVRRRVEGGGRGQGRNAGRIASGEPKVELIERRLRRRPQLEEVVNPRAADPGPRPRPARPFLPWLNGSPK